MKRLGAGLSLLLIPGLVAWGAYRYRQTAAGRALAEARAAAGTRHGKAVLRRLAERYPDSAAIQFLLADQLRLDGDSVAALAALKQAMELGLPQEASNREYLLIMATEDFRSVHQRVQTLLDANPDDRDALLALAEGYAGMSYYRRAEELANSLTQRDPEDGRGWYVRGKIHLTTHAYADAQAEFERALRLGPDRYYFPRAREYLATTLLETGQFDKALPLLQECVAEEPENLEVLFELGQCYNLMPEGQDQAIATFEKLLTLQPSHRGALLELAHLYEQRGDLKKALAYLQRIRTKNDKRAYEVYLSMAKILRALGEPDQAAIYQKKYEEEQQRFLKPEFRRPAGPATTGPQATAAAPPGGS